MKQTAGPHRVTNHYLNKIKFNLILLGPHVSFDYADVAVDPTPPVCDSSQRCVTDLQVPLVSLTGTAHIVSLTSC